LDALKGHLPGEEELIGVIEKQTTLINEWIGEHTDDEEDRPERKLGEVASSDQPHGERSIFDDVDS
jgi:hypothetical protein